MSIVMRPPLGWVMSFVIIAAIGEKGEIAGTVDAAQPANSAERSLSPGMEDILTNSVDMKLKLVSQGEFLMGASPDEAGRYTSFVGDSDELQHRVRITKAFYLGVYEVTQEQYERVMGSNPSYFSVKGAGSERVPGLVTQQFPVEGVSWKDAVKFCRRLSERENREYRLPTEAEWEYACRAGTTTAFSFGDKLSHDRDANFGRDLVHGGPEGLEYLGRTTAVGSYRPNEWGFCDMHGNVYEWCRDRYSYSFYKTSPVDDPESSSGHIGNDRVARGGHYFSRPKNCRSASRAAFSPTARNAILGFRVVLVAGTRPAKKPR